MKIKLIRFSDSASGNGANQKKKPRSRKKAESDDSNIISGKPRPKPKTPTNKKVVVFNIFALLFNLVNLCKNNALNTFVS